MVVRRTGRENPETDDNRVRFVATRRGVLRTAPGVPAGFAAQAALCQRIPVYSAPALPDGNRRLIYPDGALLASIAECPGAATEEILRAARPSPAHLIPVLPEPSMRARLTAIHTRYAASKAVAAHQSVRPGDGTHDDLA